MCVVYLFQLASVLLIVLMLCLCLVPGKVFNIEVSAVTESSLIVSWEAPTDMGGVDTVWYKVEYRTGLEIFKVFAKNLTATMAFISNLKPNSLYTIQVTAVNVVGIGISDDVMDSTVAASKQVVFV